MSSPIYYNIDGTPFAAASIPLPLSPYVSPYVSPVGSPYVSPRVSPRNSPYGVQLVPLPPSPIMYPVAIPGPSPLQTPFALSPRNDPASLAAGTNFTPHELLQFDPEDPVILWDVRLPPESIRVSNSAPPSMRGIHRLLDQSALSPPWTFMRLRSPLLLWVVECRNPSGVTVGDILEGLYECLRQKIDMDDWRETSPEFKRRLTDSWKRRYHMIGEMEGRAARIREEKRGVCRVDWLCSDYEWLGITRSKSELETWDIHFRSR